MDWGGGATVVRGGGRDRQIRIYWSLVLDLIACTISNTLLMTRMGSVMRRTTRNQSIGRWSVCTNKMTKTAMTNNDQKMRHPLDSKNTFVLFQKLLIIMVEFRFADINISHLAEKKKGTGPFSIVLFHNLHLGTSLETNTREIVPARALESPAGDNNGRFYSRSVTRTHSRGAKGCFCPSMMGNHRSRGKKPAICPFVRWITPINEKRQPFGCLLERKSRLELFLVIY